MNARDLPEKWEWNAQQEKSMEIPDDAVIKVFELCAAELRAALPEQPLSRQWREEINDEPNGEYEEGYRDAVLLFLADLDSYHDEGRELLQWIESKISGPAITSWEWHEIKDRIRKHLGGDSDAHSD